MQVASSFQHAAKRVRIKQPYICLSCRLQPRARHSSTATNDGSTPPEDHAAEDGGLTIPRLAFKRRKKGELRITFGGDFGEGSDRVQEDVTGGSGAGSQQVWRKEGTPKVAPRDNATVPKKEKTARKNARTVHNGMPQIRPVDTNCADAGSQLAIRKHALKPTPLAQAYDRQQLGGRVQGRRERKLERLTKTVAADMQISDVQRDPSLSKSQKRRLVERLRHNMRIARRPFGVSVRYGKAKPLRYHEGAYEVLRHHLKGTPDLLQHYWRLPPPKWRAELASRIHRVRPSEAATSAEEVEMQQELLAVIDAHQASASNMFEALEDDGENHEPQHPDAAPYRPFTSQTHISTQKASASDAVDTEESGQKRVHDEPQDGAGPSAYRPFASEAGVVLQGNEPAAHVTPRAAGQEAGVKTQTATDAPADASKQDTLPSDLGNSRKRNTSNRETSPSTFASSRQRTKIDMSSMGGVSRPYARLLHYSRSTRQQVAEAVDPSESYQPMVEGMQPPSKQSDIRARLRQWQELNGNKEEDMRHDTVFEEDADTEVSNSATRLPNIAAPTRPSELDQEEEREAQAHFMNSEVDELDGGFDTRTLQMGDLVELEYLNQDRESVIAIFIRRSSPTEGQFFTMTGRWAYAEDRKVPYSIPGWVSPKEVEPLLQHMPDPQNAEDREKLMTQAYTEDLSIPRHVAAPLVSRLVRFWTESQEIYRNNASSLDNAHNILAHETDLRYGSLVSAASTLLQVRPDKLPATALYTVRAALTRAGFAFNIDRRSHRLTGYLQIRSKEQVKTVNNVRRWIRDWQDHVAKRTALEAEGRAKELRQLHCPATAQYVYSFIDKARKIILKNRENRMPTISGTVSPSKKRFPITDKQHCVKKIEDNEFDTPGREEMRIVQFLEAWTCSSIFLGLPHLLSMPPLLLQAIGLYDDFPLDKSTGWQCLQELGTIMPYENRVRFDQHLLLPSSQHSKPLQNLMMTINTMKQEPGFSDTMRGLRRDWGNLPVYCIDEASAQEIDDGLSVERAGEGEWWVHIHVANPTAFFERDHALAKMARHMGETLYMPERTYTMLPRWATVGHFSLGKNRPCLTFSVKLDSDGQIKERMVNAGFVRNAIKLTKGDVQELLGQSSPATERPKHVLTVGGDPPPRRARKNVTSEVTYEQVQELKTLHMLAEKRSEIRRAAGGLFYQTDRAEVEVWQTHDAPGLAWDHPYRRGRRTIEGDPVIRLEAQEMSNHFSALSSPAQMMVQEMMLLAGEVSGMWCAERQIPALFRGTVRRPGLPDPDAFLREVLEPAARASPTGERPMHLGFDYLLFIGAAAMRTRPFKHKTLGLNYYEKVTSPLRRYGDMIAHWQIEAALREEARRGGSLVTQNVNADRDFLPFKAETLETIMLGLQPREHMITRAKMSANNYWAIMLMFRAFHYNECELPFYTPADTSKPYMRIWISNGSDRDIFGGSTGTNVELNIPATMADPKQLGMEDALRGDVWEAEIELVDVQHRTLRCRPIRLVERPTTPRTLHRY